MDFTIRIAFPLAYLPSLARCCFAAAGCVEVRRPQQGTTSNLLTSLLFRARVLLLFFSMKNVCRACHGNHSRQKAQGNKPCASQFHSELRRFSVPIPR